MAATTGSLVRIERTDEDLSFREIEPGTMYSRILHDPENGRIAYELIEPYMDQKLEPVYRKYVSLFMNDRNGKQFDINPDTGDAKGNKSNVSGTTLEQHEIEIVRYYVERDVSRYGKITGLLLDPDVEDISCEGSLKRIYVFTKEFGYIPTNVIFKDDNELNFFIRKIIQDSGKNISIADPIVDSTLPDGSRIQASIGNYVTASGPAFSIRKFRNEPFTPLDLIRLGTASAEIFAYLWVCIEYGSNIMVTGGAAAGKTVMLNSILLFIPQNLKIITIEDTRELRLPHENWLSLVSREGTGKNDPMSGKRTGEIDMFDLLTASLRHRPNYIVIGEVRGREAFTIFQAMSTGRYGMATFHAEDIGTLIHRLESKPINIPRNLIGSLDAVIVMGNFVSNGETRRRVKAISEIMTIDSHRRDMTVNNAYSINSDDTFKYSGFSYILEKIGNRYGIPVRIMERDVRIRKNILESMIRQEKISYVEFTKMIFSFYHDRDAVIESFRADR